MNALSPSVPIERLKPTLLEDQSLLRGPIAAPILADDLERLRTEEQQEIDRQRQQQLARLAELARHD